MGTGAEYILRHKKAIFAVGLVQITELQQKINKSRSIPHLG